MESPIPDYLSELLDDCASPWLGSVADYIPALAEADPDRFGVCIATVEGHVYAAGDVDLPFSIQSIAKPFVHALALDDVGLDAVLEKVDVEPSGDAFNEISLEASSGRPRNPMINAGAIATHALVRGRGRAERNNRVLRMLSRVAGRDLVIDKEVEAGELASAWRNRALAFLLRNAGALDGDPEHAVEGYIRQCSVMATTRDLAMMAATLANRGRQPVTGRQIFKPASVRQALSVMLTCGMYDSAGDWVTTVGIPAKSGVSGGIIGVLPGKVGIAVFSPRLDEHGNSVAGVRVFERLSRDLGMHIMEDRVENRAVVRGVEVVESPGGDATVLSLQGDIRFNGAEMALRRLVEEPPSTPRLVLDLHRVAVVDDIARRMLFEGVRRLAVEDGLVALVVDPQRSLGRGKKSGGPHSTERFEVGEGVFVRRLESLEDLPHR